MTADVYSMGMIVADLLDGARPGNGGALHIGGSLADVIAAAVAPDPRDRPGSVRDIVDELAAAAGRGVTALPALTDARNPYKGLGAFTEADAADFFGGDTLVDELVERVGSGGLTMVVGPSGIGKSSVVRAGLVPRLRSGALPGSEQWLVTDMFPGASPFDELAAALARVSTRQPSGLIEGLRSGRLSLDDAVGRLADGATVVLVIDQFEELYTHVPSDEERRSFLDMIVGATGSDPVNLKVVATLRADFFDKPLEDAGFGAALRDRIVPVQAMSVSELADAVRRPARPGRCRRRRRRRVGDGRRGGQRARWPAAARVHAGRAVRAPGPGPADPRPVPGRRRAGRFHRPARRGGLPEALTGRTGGGPRRVHPAGHRRRGHRGHPAPGAPQRARPALLRASARSPPCSTPSAPAGC